jgi:hypothetical protein
MIIKLIGDLEQELCSLGLKPGDEIRAVKDSISKVGAMNFDIYKNGSTYHCVVWPENYEILTNAKTQTT